MKLLLAVWLSLICFGVLAQTNGISTNAPADWTATDESIRKTFSEYSAIKLFIVPIVTVLIMGFRKLVAIIPDQLWPYISPFLGVGIDYLASKTGLWTNSPGAGAALGALAVWLHQLGSQTLEARKSGLTTTTPDGKAVK